MTVAILIDGKCDRGNHGTEISGARLVKSLPGSLGLNAPFPYMKTIMI
jgi:hypothetical protein